MSIVVGRPDRKKEDIIKDKNGYYKVSLGKLNSYNDIGIFYRINNIEDIIGEGSVLGRRLTKGILKGEKGHPDVTSMTEMELKKRTIQIDMDRTSHHIKRIELVKTGKKIAFGLDEYEVYGWVIGSGKYGEELNKDLENPDINVPFSIRSLVREKRVGNIRVRDLVIISTWDWVREPGYSNATQDRASEVGAGIGETFTVGLESKEELDNLIAGIEEDMVGVECKDGVCVIKGLKNSKKLFEDGNPIYRW